MSSSVCPQQFGVVNVGCGHHHGQRPPLPSARTLRLLPALARPVGLGPTESPQNGPCPWRSTQPAIPTPPRPVPLTPQPVPPRADRAPPTPPPRWKVPGKCLESAMYGAVISQFFGQTVALATAPHPEGDAVHHTPGVYPFAPRCLERVHFQDYRANLLPKVNRNLPYRP